MLQDFTRFFSQHAEALTAFARIGQASTEKLVQLHLEAGRSGFDAQAATVQAALTLKDWQSAQALRQKTVEDGLDYATQFSQQWWAIAGEAQAQWQTLAHDQAASHKDHLEAGLDRFATSLPAAAPLVGVARNALQASAVATDTLNKAARQAADFAGASLKAAAETSVGAIKAANRRTTA